MIRLITIKRLQRVALVERGRLVRLLGPGWNLVWTLGRELILYDLTDPVQAIAVGDVLPEGTAGQRALTVGEGERVLVTIDGAQRRILGPGRWRVWEGVADVRLTRVSQSAGMILQHFDFAMRADDVPVYTGNTYFGFFSKAAQ